VKIFRALYINNRFFQAIFGLVVLFVLGFFFPILTGFSKGLFLLLLVMLLMDLAMVFAPAKGLLARRLTPDKLSNGDENELGIQLTNHYRFDVDLRIIDEVPIQFQYRKMDMRVRLEKLSARWIAYVLRPVKRGEYSFGRLNVYVAGPLGLISRRYKFEEDKTVPVYPSYIQMRKYELLAISNRLQEFGIKKIRRIGQNREFEQIREYVKGDDYRTINWKATARKGDVMVNSYQDERSQQVYCLVDKGRVMMMPFQGMSLLDYAINATLVISNIAISKDDKAGLITFQHKPATTLRASKSHRQMHLVMETLYNQKTAYKESDYSALFTHVRRTINQRSLLLLFTNFESQYALERQLPYLRKLAKDHLLVVIFFENTEIKGLLTQPAQSLREVYWKTMAEKFTYDKKLIVKELQKHGIQTILTAPEHLTVNTINKYLEIKARGLI
jgi:uncharacterized protein (DUF58 family)